ncbi:hypothetical protein [Campylobacter concisus]|uniref:hypothetical protein n=1 Tax=Campylobacter concisus TaxID=199 RepID=UPI00122CB4EA|nr:hypothetical protein [Campylobacter concisus]
MHIAPKIGDIFAVKLKRNELYFVAQILNNGDMLKCPKPSHACYLCKLDGKELEQICEANEQL